MIHKIHSTPIGDLHLIIEAGNLIYCKWLYEQSAIVGTRRAVSPTTLGDEKLMSEIIRQIDCYLEGNLQNFTIPFKLDGTPFQHSVWNCLSQIPYGETLSYGELAQKIGNPKAIRAVAQACGRNPIVLIVPCHRIVGSHGKLGGYTGGIEKKISLLRIEGSEYRGIFENS